MVKMFRGIKNGGRILMRNYIDSGCSSEFLIKKAKYLEAVASEDMSKYDIKFVDFYRNGKILINNKEYINSDLYILLGEKDNEKKVMLLSNQNIMIDIFSGESYRGYKKIYFLNFRKSECFHNIYKMYQEKIINNALIINDVIYNSFLNELYKFDGKIHMEVPETKIGLGKY